MGRKKTPWTTGSVALVGSAESLRYSTFGKDIDSYDHVIRINQGAFATLDADSTGLRTDWVFLTLTGRGTWERLGFLRRARKVSKGVALMSPLRRRVARVDLGLFVPHYPDQWFSELEQRLGSRPSSGAMALDYLVKTMDDPTALHLYGFDFFATPDIAHGRNNIPNHNPDAERDYFFDTIDAARFHQSPTTPPKDDTP
jgi:hypothetical protein